MASVVDGTTNDAIGRQRGLSESSGTHSSLPPRPVPFGTHSTSLRKFSVDSIESREGLRRDLNLRRKSLTAREHHFLEQLVLHGNEGEVALARAKLGDQTLFFDDSWGNAADVSGRESSVGSITANPEDADASTLVMDAGGSRGSRASSERAKIHLEQRRTSGWHGKMWKAHESGLAVTSIGTKKSLMRRSNSANVVPDIKREAAIRSSSILSTLTELLLEGGPTDRPGEDAVFRGNGSTNNASTIETAGRSSMTPGQIPPAIGLFRVLSDGSRKSVSFREGTHDEVLIEPRQRISPIVPRRTQNADRGNSVGSLGSLGLEYLANEGGSGLPLQSTNTHLRGYSTSSIPSLHMGKPIRSDSVSSIPPIHHASRLRSESSSTIPSIPQGVPLRDDSNTSTSLLHRAHPVRSDSITASSIGGSFDFEHEDAAWSAPLPRKADLSNGQLLRHPSQPEIRPVLLRSASNKIHCGEGIEVSEMDDTTSSSFQRDSLSTARNFNSMVSMGDESSRSVRTSPSYDNAQDNAAIFRGPPTSHEDEDIRSYFLGAAKALLFNSDNSGDNKNDLDYQGASWDMESNEDVVEHYDAWNVLKDEYAVGYGANNTLPFRILGTSADDVDAHPHVLSPPLMESLQNFFPYSISEDNFWMKYSLLRDGASMHSLLQHSRGAKYTIIAIETVDGEVFGSFTADSWRKDWNYFGSGEAFLWRMRQPRVTPCHSIIDQAQLESELDVYPWTGDNNCVQLCTHEKLAVGGGTPSMEKKDDKSVWGFGLAIDRDLLHGTSSHCATFGSPPLSHIHDSSPFEIVNIEVWTTTPCYSLEDAEKLEMGKLFLQSN